MSDGEKKSGSKKRGIAAMKEKYEDRIAELEAELAAKGTAMGPSTGRAAAAVHAMEATFPKSGYAPTTDPLAWIDESVDSVYLVGDNLYLTGSTVNVPRGAKPEDVVEDVKAYADKDWVNCPFRVVGRSQEETNNLRIMRAKYHHHRVDRFYADRVFASKWGPMPKKSCVRPEDFHGYDHQRQPHGQKTACSTDTLRELVRYYCQRYAGHIWIDYTYHRGQIDFGMPNPYGKGRDRFEVDPATVRRATEEGDVLGTNYPEWTPPRKAEVS